MTSLLTRIGENIRNYREAQGLSQEKLAELAGLTSHHVSKLERACSWPKLDTLYRICEALGITLNDVVYRDPTDPEQDGNYETGLDQKEKQQWRKVTMMLKEVFDELEYNKK